MLCISRVTIRVVSIPLLGTSVTNAQRDMLELMRMHMPGMFTRGCSCMEILSILHLQTRPVEMLTNVQQTMVDVEIISLVLILW